MYDDCLHDVVRAHLESFFAGHPARNCPPEDVGGVSGYDEYLEAIADPNHDQHDDFVEWRGPFDAEEFDAKKTTKTMRRGLPDWRRHE